MEENQNLLKKGIILVSLILIISIFISSYLKLDKPVFLKSYIDRYFLISYENQNSDANFIIRYITNIDDSRVVNHIEFEEYPNLNINASEYNPFGFNFFNEGNETPGQAVGRYSVREIYISIDAINMENQNDDIHLKKAKVYFSDGSMEEVDIGEVVLYLEDEINASDHFEFMRVKSSSDGLNTSQERLNENIELIKMEGQSLERFKDLVEIKIGSKDYRDIAGDQYKTGDYLTIDTVFEMPQDPELRMYNYDLRPELFYKDSQDNIFTYRLHNLDYRKHSFEFLEIINFLRARGEI